MVGYLVYHFIYIVVDKLDVFNLAKAIVLVVVVIEEHGRVLIKVCSSVELDLGNGSIRTVEKYDVEVQSQVVTEGRTVFGAELEHCHLISLRCFVHGKLVAIGNIVSVHGASLGEKEVRGGEPCVVGDGRHPGGSPVSFFSLMME